MIRLTRELCLALRRYTAEVIAAREEYAAHPTVAEEQDWCEHCAWPRRLRNCTVCKAHMAMRGKREAS